jgi:hypothetical protein
MGLKIKPDSRGLVPATHELGNLHGAAYCATLATGNGAAKLERGAVSRAI